MCAKHSEAGHSELLSCGSTCRFDEIVKSKVSVSPAVFEGMWVWSAANIVVLLWWCMPSRLYRGFQTQLKLVFMCVQSCLYVLRGMSCLQNSNYVGSQ